MFLQVSDSWGTFVEDIGVFGLVSEHVAVAFGLWSMESIWFTAMRFPLHWYYKETTWTEKLKQLKWTFDLPSRKGLTSLLYLSFSRRLRSAPDFPATFYQIRQQHQHCNIFSCLVMTMDWKAWVLRFRANLVYSYLVQSNFNILELGMCTNYN